VRLCGFGLCGFYSFGLCGFYGFYGFYGFGRIVNRYGSVRVVCKALTSEGVNVPCIHRVVVIARGDVCWGRVHCGRY
jgi:hypothetical protein